MAGRQRDSAAARDDAERHVSGGIVFRPELADNYTLLSGERVSGQTVHSLA